MSDEENDKPKHLVGDERVGYRRPPTVRRFKSSGNKKGRPKGAKNRKTIVQAVANETHIVQENGKRRKRSTLELVLYRLRNLALEGKNLRAIEELHRLIKAYQPEEFNDKLGCLVVPAPQTNEEFIAQAEKDSAKQDALHVARSREFDLMGDKQIK